MGIDKIIPIWDDWDNNHKNGGIYLRLFGIEVIEEYAKAHADERDILAAFSIHTRAAAWTKYADIPYYSATKEGKTLFKLGTNTRLTAVITYAKTDELKTAKPKPDGSFDIGRVLVIRILTHEQYNSIDWATGKRKPKRG